MAEAIMNQKQQAKRRQKRTDQRRILVSGLATFSVMLTLIGAQVATGKDPAIGHGTGAKAASTRTTQTVASTFTGAGDDGYSDAEYGSEGYGEDGSSVSAAAGVPSSGGHQAPVVSSHAS